MVTLIESRFVRCLAASRSASLRKAGGERITMSVCGRACRFCAVTAPTVSGVGKVFVGSISTNSRRVSPLAGMENVSAEPSRRVAMRLTR